MASDVSNCELERRQRAAVVMVVLVVGAALLATVYGLSMTAAVLASWITGR